MQVSRAMVFFLLLIATKCLTKNRPVITFITILMQLNGAKRDFSTYLNYFKDILVTPSNLIVFGQAPLRQFVYANRPSNNTFFIQLTKKNISTRWENKLIYKSFKNAYKRKNQSPQMNKCFRFYQNIQFYMPLVMQKMYWMHYAMKIDPFRSDFYSWIDAGVTHMLTKDYFTPHNAFEHFRLFTQTPFQMHQYAWKAKGLFDSLKSQQKQLKYISRNVEPKQYILGGYFGGRADAFPTAYHVWQNFLRVVLQNKQVGFEQTFYTMLRYRYPLLFTTVTHMKITNYKIQINSRVFLQPQQQRKWRFAIQAQKQQTPRLLFCAVTQEISKQIQFLRQTLYYQISFLVFLLGILIYIQKYRQKPKKQLLNDAIKAYCKKSQQIYDPQRLVLSQQFNNQSETKQTIQKQKECQFDDNDQQQKLTLK